MECFGGNTELCAYWEPKWLGLIMQNTTSLEIASSICKMDLSETKTSECPINESASGDCWRRQTGNIKVPGILWANASGSPMLRSEHGNSRAAWRESWHRSWNFLPLGTTYRVNVKNYAEKKKKKQTAPNECRLHELVKALCLNFMQWWLEPPILNLTSWEYQTCHFLTGDSWD